MQIKGGINDPLEEIKEDFKDELNTELGGSQIGASQDKSQNGIQSVNVSDVYKT